MKRRKLKKRIVLTLVLIVFVILCFCIGRIIYKKWNTFNVKVIEKIENYPYTLDDRDTELFKQNFYELKSILQADSINYEDYAKAISKLFVIDLYTMNNKVNKYDIGSVEYVYPEAVDNYKLKVQDTLYKYMNDNTDKNRNQELPIVKKVDVQEIKGMDFKVSEESYEAFKVELTWDYEKDLKYDNKGKVFIVKKNNILYVAEYVNG